jgi:hypothetical protein
MTVRAGDRHAPILAPCRTDCYSPENLTMETSDIEHYRHRLVELRVEHRDLDDVIARLAKDPLVDELELKRLKKRKLMLKDMIAHLESKLIPDLNA